MFVLSILSTSCVVASLGCSALLYPLFVSHWIKAAIYKLSPALFTGEMLLDTSSQAKLVHNKNINIRMMKMSKIMKLVYIPIYFYKAGCWSYCEQFISACCIIESIFP